MGTSEESPCPTIRVSVNDRVNEQQANACAAILRTLLEWFGDAEAVTEYLNNLPIFETYVAQREAEIVGFAAMKRKSAHVAEIHVMGVAREERRRRVGRALINRMVDDLARSGIRSLSVQTLGPSDADQAYVETRAFYEAMSFVPIREFRQAGWTGPTLTMVRTL